MEISTNDTTPVSFQSLFEDVYNQSITRASINYLSLGFGFIIGL